MKEPTIQIFFSSFSKFLTEYAEVLQKISDNHQGFFVGNCKASSLAGKQF